MPTVADCPPECVCHEDIVVSCFTESQPTSVIPPDDQGNRK